MTKRRRIVVGNWKMHETNAEARRLASGVVASLDRDAGSVIVVLAPPFTALYTVGDVIAGTEVTLGAQTMHWADSGAYTGEISPPMLLELGVRYVILGHSERRRYCGERDAQINARVKAALSHGLVPIVAVGETAEERDAGATDERVAEQTRRALEGVGTVRAGGLVMAYEPIWAIGSGRNCDPMEADRVMRTIRSTSEILAEAPLLYGGSVTPANFAAYLGYDNCSGALVGGASLDARAFSELARIAMTA